MSESIIELLIEDIQGRDTVGRAKYGKPLLPFDGRRTLQDAYEEALDLAVYIKKEMVERAVERIGNNAMPDITRLRADNTRLREALEHVGERLSPIE